MREVEVKVWHQAAMDARNRAGAVMHECGLPTITPSAQAAVLRAFADHCDRQSREAQS